MKNIKLYNKESCGLKYDLWTESELNNLSYTLMSIITYSHIHGQRYPW